MKRAPLIRLYDDEGIIDGFAGGGGTSTGIEMALGRSPDVAINHDAEALAMHAKNHPTTRHLHSNIRIVNFRRVLVGQRCGLAWFSPDCTFHSKARGGKPFRDRDRARRIRGLAWEAVRCAEAITPRVIAVENVEEFKDWGPLDKATGRPDPAKRGMNFRRWVARLENLGYVVEWRELRACDYGAPTTRKRLFVIARCDGQPIRWPEPTHGPRRAQPYRAAAECIDWSIPVPSIFLTPAEAKQWGHLHGLPTPKRPLAAATLRRIARGVQRYVLNAADPFIVPVMHQGDSRVYGIREPLRTITTASRGEFALVAPTLIQTSYGERQGQSPRILDIQAPLGTIVAGGIKHSVVAAFLAKHNGGHEATGQALTRPADTIVCRENKALVAASLIRYNGTKRGGEERGQAMTCPVSTLDTSNRLGLVSAFLVKFFGSKKDGIPVDRPLDTLTTKDRYALCTVTIGGEEYAIVDIGMRMLTPRELFRAQGFPPEYHIHGFSKKAQTRLVGNSVPPHVAAAIVGANLAQEVA